MRTCWCCGASSWHCCCSSSSCREKENKTKHWQKCVWIFESSLLVFFSQCNHYLSASKHQLEWLTGFEKASLDQKLLSVRYQRQGDKRLSLFKNSVFIVTTLSRYLIARKDTVCKRKPLSKQVRRRLWRRRNRADVGLALTCWCSCCCGWNWCCCSCRCKTKTASSQPHTSNICFSLHPSCYTFPCRSNNNFVINLIGRSFFRHKQRDCSIRLFYQIDRRRLRWLSQLTANGLCYQIKSNLQLTMLLSSGSRCCRCCGCSCCYKSTLQAQT